jgi:hyperosmotically inducible protein
MHAAGSSLENAGDDTGHAAVHAYHGTATAMRDSKITLKVKTALHEDKLTKHAEIHVTTTAGIVKLTGVASDDAAARAERIAKHTEGVKDVDNLLKVSSAAASDE